MVPFPRGLIEGFYGHGWSWDQRQSYAGYLKAIGFEFYIYAPKSDPLLRENWMSPYPDDQLSSLKKLSEIYRTSDVSFGIGFSPVGYDSSRSTELKNKLEQINDINPSILCILFDDIKGKDPDLALKQTDLTLQIQQLSTASHFIVCPTYYSTQPILEKLFGKMPEGYLEDLGEGLPEEFDIFWTGERVISHQLSETHLSGIAKSIRRKPFIWDNSFSNDADMTAPYVRPFVDFPSPQGANGQAFNGMNQAELFKLSLKKIVDDVSPLDACRSICGESMGDVLHEDLLRLASIKQCDLNEEYRDALFNRYSALDHPIAKQLLLWVDGHYQFDPSCFT